MSHARIEEVSDSDPSEGDISDVHSDFDDRDILKRRTDDDDGGDDIRTSTSTSTTQRGHHSSLLNPAHLPSSAHDSSSASAFDPQQLSAEASARFKSFPCVYPVYFDKRRTRREGRRVGTALAVENPLARGLVDACAALGLETCFEPLKTHPRDWANPGRVRVGLAGQRVVKNKHHLYTLISRHLLAHPTTTETALRVQIPGAPAPDPSKPYPVPATPLGWKVGTIVPHYSAALSGGGVSEDFLRDMMAGMQGGGGGAGAGGGAGMMPGMPDLGGMGGMGSMMQNLLGAMGGGGGPSDGPAPAPKQKQIRVKKGKR